MYFRTIIKVLRPPGMVDLSVGILSKLVHRVRSLNAVSLTRLTEFWGPLPMCNHKRNIIYMHYDAAQGVGLPCPPPPFNLLKLSFNLGLGASPLTFPSSLVGELSTIDVDGAL